MSAEKKTIGRIGAGIAAGIALVACSVLSPIAASAHVGLAPEGDPEAGSTLDLTFGIGHGCDGSPTTGLEVAVPEEGITGVTPIVQAGWDVEVVNEGDAGRPSAVRFTPDEPVPDEMRAEIRVSVGIDSDAEGPIAFPVEQTCAEGSTSWNEIAEEGQDPHDLESPAPVLEVVAASGESEHAGHGGEASDEAADAEEAGDGVLPVALGGAGLAAGLAALVVSIIALRRRA
ncbi:MAG: YcnI family copper-binding membrane protein [Microbacterium sp.]